MDKYDVLLSHHRETKDEIALLRAELEKVKIDAESNAVIQMQIIDQHMEAMRAEIQELKKSIVTSAYVRLSFNTAVGANQIVSWDGPCTPQLLPTNNFRFAESSERKEVTVNKKGLYQITLRLSPVAPSRYNGPYQYSYGNNRTAIASLMVNGNIISSITFGTSQVTEILELDQDSTISVIAGASVFAGANNAQYRNTIKPGLYPQYPKFDSEFGDQSDELADQSNNCLIIVLL